MAKVQITNMTVLDNPSPFQSPIQLEITFECIEDLAEDLEWKIVYVGSAENEDHDQTLDSVLVGPVPSGRHMFVFRAEPPDPAKIPGNDVVGVTAVILTCAYKEKEFVRVGYYVNNDYADPELRENPPPTPRYDLLHRDIFASKPIVTRYKIDWDDAPEPGATMEQMHGEQQQQQPTEGMSDSNQKPQKIIDENLNFSPTKAEAVSSPGGMNGCHANGSNGHFQEDSNGTMDTS